MVSLKGLATRKIQGTTFCRLGIIQTFSGQKPWAKWQIPTSSLSDKTIFLLPARELYLTVSLVRYHLQSHHITHHQNRGTFDSERCRYEYMPALSKANLHIESPKFKRFCNGRFSDTQDSEAKSELLMSIYALQILLQNSVPGGPLKIWTPRSRLKPNNQYL